MKKTLNILMITSAILFSCHAKNQEGKSKPISKEMVMPHPAPKANLKEIDLAVKKDLVCGMPITAGIVDTAQFKGKVYGFCAAECKAAFLKDPNQYLSIKK